MHNMPKQMGYFSRTPHWVPLQLAKSSKLRPLFTQTHQEWKNVAWFDELSSATFTQTLFKCQSQSIVADHVTPLSPQCTHLLMAASAG